MWCSKIPFCLISAKRLLLFETTHNFNFPIMYFFRNKDHYVYAVAADRKAASRLDSSLRSKHSSGLPRRPTSAKVSHTIAPTTTSTRFLSSQQQAFGYTTYYYYTVDSTVCIVYQGRRVPAPLHIFFFSPAHHHRAVCPPPPPAAGSFAAHRRTPPFLKSVVLGRVTWKEI